MAIPTPPRQPHHTLRLLSILAATTIALSCGTNYAYSAWAPTFASHLHLSATQQNLIGNFGNIGMYAMGIPGGILIDKCGPRYGVGAGVVALAAGYFGLWRSFERGAGATGMGVLCLFGLLTGMGSCTAFSAAIKVSATNWPRHRGTATAFPLSAFGLSAFFYTTIASVAFPGETQGYLLLLACGTTVMVFVGMFFLQIVRGTGDGKGGYEAVSGGGEEESRGRRDSNKMSRARSGKDDAETGKLHPPPSSLPYKACPARSLAHSHVTGTADEHSSLVSSNSTAGPGDDLEIRTNKQPTNLCPSSSKPEITGLVLLRTPAFWQLFLLLGLLCGVGLMTINNIGNNARALWHHFDPSTTAAFIQKRQLLHVSILSLCSFAGRLASGIGSDWLIHRNQSRYWTLVASGTLFTAAQVVALQLQDPRRLFWLSGLTGLAYGALFGVYPALVADAFGPSGLGINWGAMTMAPVLSGNFFNLAYGAILDSHSRFRGDGKGGGEMVCVEGRECYGSAYWVTLAASLAGVGWTLGCIWREGVKRRREGGGGREHEG
ncbi:hypothetical protein LTR62_006841 [Meristemomyces frigidus]|uniref:Nodulin-like domain-containing protein n=1 Tax=Meristemomyces frigidus TaxID=1508187 RepID=A0AAN7TD31_9PEZI|nr:hypothetical protein LTR62_006841 [Meristemomyces frigidus]